MEEKREVKVSISPEMVRKLRVTSQHEDPVPKEFEVLKRVVKHVGIFAGGLGTGLLLRWWW